MSEFSTPPQIEVMEAKINRLKSLLGEARKSVNIHSHSVDESTYKQLEQLLADIDKELI